MTVALVGAGPGDPGLLTRRGAELLAAADDVVYDRLTAVELLDLAPDTAVRHFVGKGPGTSSTPQADINDLLVELGRAGRSVVRLKGGDPFVFARGGEEAFALAAAGIEVEIVPGITSAIAAPAYAGIPVTKRFSSTSFTVVTGHEDPAKEHSHVDWEAIAAVGGTLLILMGVANIEEIARRLQAGGRSPHTPVAAVRWGTRPNQEVVRSTLGAIADEPLAAPSVIVVGEVAAEALEWYGRSPLFGRTVVVTRAKAQSSRLTDRLRARGAMVLGVPAIRIADAPDGGAGLADAVGRLASYDWVVLGSPNAAARFLDAVGDLRRLGDVRLAAMGPGTAASLESARVPADLVPERYVAEGLVEAFPAPPSDRPGRVLVPRAAVARDVLVDGLRAAGWEVDVVVAYETVPADIDADTAARIAAADVVAFASSSAARSFAAAVAPSQRPPVAAAIGPITAATAREVGFADVVEAEVHDLDGLVAAVELAATGRPRG